MQVRTSRQGAACHWRRAGSMDQWFKGVHNFLIYCLLPKQNRFGYLIFLVQVHVVETHVLMRHEEMRHCPHGPTPFVVTCNVPTPATLIHRVRLTALVNPYRDGLRVTQITIACGEDNLIRACLFWRWRPAQCGAVAGLL
jgi:hypothetical protein